MDIFPLEPATAAPEANVKTPLTPPDPELLLRTTTDPLLLVVAEPLIMDNAPPVDPVVSPPFMVTAPPLASALPAVTMIAPDFAPVPAEVPEVILTLPLEPLLVVPVWNVISPLIPSWPAFEVRSTRAPLDFTLPRPLVTDVPPPV